MSQAECRLLDPELIPKTLWASASDTLFIAPTLAKAYETLIDRHSLRGLSQSRDPDDPPLGGLSQEHTDKHFAQAFDGSVARVELALLDPKQAANLTSNALIPDCHGLRNTRGWVSGWGGSLRGFSSRDTEIDACSKRSTAHAPE
jgi:hypothetical protein